VVVTNLFGVASLSCPAAQCVLLFAKNLIINDNQKLQCIPPNSVGREQLLFIRAFRTLVLAVKRLLCAFVNVLYTTPFSLSYKFTTIFSDVAKRVS